MRKILLSFIFIPIIAGQSVWAQNEWAPVGSVWYYQESYFMSPDTGYALFEVTGDTVINGINSSIIRGKGGFWYLPGWNVQSYDTIMYAYTYKMNDTVFFYNKEQNIFVPIFFFNSNEGDHWIFTWDWCNYDFIVDSIRFYENNGVIQKYFFLQGTSYYTIIENIGGTFFFTPDIWCDSITIDGAMLDGLRCYYDPQFGLFTYTTLPCNYDADIMESFYDNSESSIIFPNPVKDVLNIYPEYECRLIIRNMFGDEIKKIPLMRGNNVIDVNNMPSGVIILEIQGKNSTNNYKIIKL